jgi:hypothetical protein
MQALIYHRLNPDNQDLDNGEGMGKQKGEQPLAPKRTREELAKHFMRIRLQDAERRAQEYLNTLDPREKSPNL